MLTEKQLKDFELGKLKSSCDQLDEIYRIFEAQTLPKVLSPLTDRREQEQRIIEQHQMEREQDRQKHQMEREHDRERHQQDSERIRDLEEQLRRQQAQSSKGS